MEERIIPYSPAMDRKIRNIAALPRGLKCPYLKVVEALEPGVWIARSWHRRMPKQLGPCEAIISFNNNKETR